MKISIGDRVLVKWSAFEGKHKIENKLEADTYIIIDIHWLDISVYKVEFEQADKERILHRNHYQDDELDNEDAKIFGATEGSDINRDAFIAAREETMLNKSHVTEAA